MSKLAPTLVMDLQLFNEGNPPQDTVASLDSLLDGNTVNQEPEPKDPEPPTPDNNPGGDPSLEPSEPDAPADPDNKDPEPPAPDGGKDVTPPEPTDDQRKQNAAFAKLRAESTQANKIIEELSKALGIKEGDPEKKRQQLLTLAHEKLAKEQQIPVELYQELNTTKETLAEMQKQQNMVTARDKFAQLGDAYKLEKDQMMDFAKRLDDEGINVVGDPDVDLEYHYYRLNKEKIIQDRVDKAVAEALNDSNTAETHASTPSKQSSKQTGSPSKVSSVSALNSLLDG